MNGTLTTKATSGQSIAPAISAKSRTPLSKMTPTRPEAQNVIAKTSI